MSLSKNLIYDPLYGFIQLTSVEKEIISSPFYQRLRWIKQIGFSFYTFPGAEHSRFGHSIGVMFNAHCILKSVAKAVSDREFFDESKKSKNKTFHQAIRLSALLHDLGTFCFSHTTEIAYIKWGKDHNKNSNRSDDHENLGSYIIKNTDYEKGITYILKKYNLDPQMISDMVKGKSQYILANQILHSEIDCDRMDYLLRDAHYTGLNYGTYDRDYLLHHFNVSTVGDEEVLTISKNALHCVEDFLSSRFAWYSQVVRSARGAKFDSLAYELTLFLLEKRKIYSYSELLELVKNEPEKFYGFNDQYFMTLIHRLFLEHFFDPYPKYKDIAERLLFAHSPRVIKAEEIEKKILKQDGDDKEKQIRKAQEFVEKLEKVIKKKGGDKDWLVIDIPKRPIVFVRSKKSIVKELEGSNLMHDRDAVKILDENGNLKLLVDVEDSIISQLQNLFHFIPNVYVSDSAYELLSEEGMIS